MLQCLSPDPTTVVRILNATIQRVKGCYSQLNSSACFVVYSDRQNSVVVWHGNDCIRSDRNIAESIGRETRREMNALGTIDVIEEDSSTPENRERLLKLLSLLWMSEEDYNSERLRILRSGSISNSPKVLHSIQRIKGGKYSMQKVTTVSPDEYGIVPKISLEGLCTSVAMFVLFVDGQWDLWLGESISPGEEEVAKSMIKSLQSSQVSSTRSQGLDAVVFGEQIRIVRQYFERAVFCAQFESNWHLGKSIVRQQVTKIIYFLYF